MLLFTLLTIFLITLAVNIILFIPASILKSDHFTDAAYSTSFLATILYFYYTNTHNIATSILTALISIWALRLGAFLVYRIRKIKKDRRFDDTRNSIAKFAAFWFYQSIVAALILLAATNYLQTGDHTIETAQIIGLCISIFALSFETIADQQKLIHILKKKKGFIKTGLWKYSRHPNYFGEILFWIGVYIFSLTNNITSNLITVISPICIAAILIFVSGIPLLEKSADKKYKKETPILIPKIRL